MKVRTSKPEKGNKYYTRKQSGGYSLAVKGKPTDACDALANCVGYANGRFAEIIGKDKIEYQLVCNAENFIEKAKSYGLEVGQTPKTGAIMCWQKGNTLNGSDGAGHVAIVERVNSDGSVYTSESGYNSKAFWNATRSNSNGRWGIGSGYKFRGFIYNPAVKEEPVISKPNVLYQVYDNSKKKWLGTITNYNNTNSNGYAGIKGHSIGGIRVKLSNGAKIQVRSHIKNGKWLNWISQWNDTTMGYSGIKGKAIDGIQVKSDVGTVVYRVHIKNGKWLNWISKADDTSMGYAGIYGKEIDMIQMYIK